MLNNLPTKSNTEALYWSICWKLNIYETNLKQNHNSWWFTLTQTIIFLHSRLSFNSHISSKYTLDSHFFRFNKVVKKINELKSWSYSRARKMKVRVAPDYLSTALVARCKHERLHSKFMIVCKFEKKSEKFIFILRLFHR